MTGTRGAERPGLVALRAKWLFDGTASALVADPVVVVDGGTIVSVGHGVEPPDGAQIVDLDGATLMPGLVDTHVHLVFDSSADPVQSLASRTPQEALSAATRAAQSALSGGVTTVRDLGDRGYLSLVLRGRPDLPTILAAGPPITTPAGHCHFLGGGTEPTVEGVRSAVRERVERGVDVIKIMASGGTMTPGSRQEATQFPADVLAAAVDEAHRHGLPITAHAHGTGSIRDALDAGTDGIEHVSFWSADGVDDPGDFVDVIVDRQVVLGATVGLVPVDGVVPPPEILQRLPQMLANGRRLIEAGARIAAATDAGISPLKPPYVCRYAPAQLRELGMDGAAALRTVTSVAAEVCGLGDRKGRIAPGFDADLLAVAGDPLTEPDAIHRIVAVYRNGSAVSLEPPPSVW